MFNSPEEWVPGQKPTIYLDNIKGYVEEIVRHMYISNGILSTEAQELLDKQYVTIEKTEDIDKDPNPDSSLNDKKVYRITVKNLIIVVPEDNDPEFEEDNIWETSIHNIVNGERMQRLYIYELLLDNVTFEASGIHCPLKIDMRNSRSFSIHACYFEGVGVIILTQNLKNFAAPLSTEAKNYHHMRNINISIQNSTFDYLKIFAHFNSNKDTQFCQFYLSKNTIEVLLIEALKGNDYELKLINQNQIDTIQIPDKYPKVLAWGTQEKIMLYSIKAIHLEKYNNFFNPASPQDFRTILENNKSVFVNFKKQAIDGNNELHEKLFKHHIIKCDDALIDLEPNKSSWQDKVTMFMGRKLSNHGTSWLRPILHILWINFTIAIAAIFPIIAMPITVLIFAIIVLMLISSTATPKLRDSPSPVKTKFSTIISWFKFFTPLLAIIIFVVAIPLLLHFSYQISKFALLYFELFNPLVALNNIAEKTCLIEESWWLSFLTIISKFFYGVCGYELWRSARRFTPR